MKKYQIVIFAARRDLCVSLPLATRTVPRLIRRPFGLREGFLVLMFVCCPDESL